MRVFYSLLILIIIGSTVGAESPKVRTTKTLFQARGLERNQCYREIGAISCKEGCMLTLFPRMAVQLNLSIKDMPSRARKEMGHFFLVDFRVLDEEATTVTLLKWQPKSVFEVRNALKGSMGLVKGHSCR
jgi:hypothetical protein